MRLMLLHNLNVANNWANGTRVRLLASQSWTGVAHKMQSSRVKEKTWEKTQVYLHEADKFPEFNVKVVKDEECTLAKRVKFADADVSLIPVREDKTRTYKGTEERWKQVQAALAYALTAHKAQGLTMDTVYLCWLKMFGFGIPYTMCTRTPWEDNMYFVGVPPFDVLAAILQVDSTGQNKIQRKRAEIDSILRDDEMINAEVERRIQLGEFNLSSIAQDLATEGWGNYSLESQAPDKNDGLAQARTFLKDKIRRRYEEWRGRLDTEGGLEAMCSVNEGFKFKKGLLTPQPNRIKLWTSLATVLQGDSENRKRIWYYHDVAVDWMQHPMVNALATAKVGQPNLARRIDKRPDHVKDDPRHHMNQAVDGYGVESRPQCPSKPESLQWSTQDSYAVTSQQPSTTVSDAPMHMSSLGEIVPQNAAIAPPVDSSANKRCRTL